MALARRYYEILIFMDDVSVLMSFWSDDRTTPIIKITTTTTKGEPVAFILSDRIYLHKIRNSMHRPFF